MSRRIDIGDYHVGPYCGASLFRPKTWWKYYGLFRKTSSGFSLGPIYFWKEILDEHKPIFGLLKKIRIRDYHWFGFLTLGSLILSLITWNTTNWIFAFVLSVFIAIYGSTTCILIAIDRRPKIEMPVTENHYHSDSTYN